MNQPLEVILHHPIARGTAYFIDLYRGWFTFGFTTLLYIIIIKMLMLIDNVIILMILSLYYHYTYYPNANTDGPSLICLFNSDSHPYDPKMSSYDYYHWDGKSSSTCWSSKHRPHYNKAGYSWWDPCFCCLHCLASPPSGRLYRNYPLSYLLTHGWSCCFNHTFCWLDLYPIYFVIDFDFWARQYPHFAKWC